MNICDALPQKEHKVFFWHFEVLAEMKTREKDLSFDPYFIEIGYSERELWHFKVDEVRIVHFEKNAFEDICVDDARKPLATGTKYKPKQMKVSKHAM